MRKLLILGAHPDDETFFAGGTLAKYASEGAEITVVSATRGERGGTAGLSSIEELPKVREAELRNAMAILGVQHVHFLPYQDQQLAAAPIDVIREQLVQIIREAEPQVVLTFDPHGGNQHPDHMAISRFSSDAIAAAADPRWFPQAGPAHPPTHQVQRLVWQPLSPLWDLPRDADLAAQPGFDFLIDVEAWAEQKEAALRAHATQVPAFGRIFFEHPNRARMFAVEPFRLAFGPHPANIPATDLFAGLTTG